MRIKSLLSLLKRRRVNYSSCADKNDLVDLICDIYRIPMDVPQGPRPIPMPSGNGETNFDRHSGSGISGDQTTTSQTSNMPPSFPPPDYNEAVGEGNVEQVSTVGNSEATCDDGPAVSGENKFKDMVRISLGAIDDIDQIELLSVAQLKQLLAANHMQIATGCKEKEELRQQVRMLFIAEQRRLHQANSGESSNWEVTCKICMSNEIDCVLLDCGHLCCCLECGKTLAECPMCRALVVRTLRVFKS